MKPILRGVYQVNVGRAWLSLLCVSITSCSADRDQATAIDFGFRALGTIVLEESDSAFVSNIWHEPSVAISQDGLIAVADRMIARVLLYNPDGSLYAIVGREGQGPGEFDAPQSVAWDSNRRLWVADYLNRRVTVFRPDLELDEVFTVSEGSYLSSVQAAANQVVFAVDYEVMGRDSFEEDVIVTYEYEPVQPRTSFLTIDPRAVAPYVGAEYHPVSRVAEDSVFAGSNLGYPLTIYTLDGERLGEFGTAPPSLRTVRHPEPFEFAADPRAGAEWLRSFGRISSIQVVQDSLILIDHQHLNPEVLDRREEYHLGDLYSRWSLEKMAEDVPLPGRIMHSAGDTLWVLTGRPPGPWELTKYELYRRWR